MRGSFVLALAAFVAGPAAAETVVFEYAGVIHAVNHSVFDSIATVGDLVTGRVTYDDAALDTNGDPTVGVYPGATHEFQFGTYSGTSTQSQVRIYDTAGFDAFQIIDFEPADELATISGLPVNSVALALNGTAALYASDALPAAPPLLANPELVDPYASISVVPPGTGSTPLSGDLEGLVVPEPAHSALLAAVVVAALRQRSRA